MNYTLEEKKELMIPSLYWVSQMVKGLGEIARNEWWEKKDESLRYDDEIIRYFGVVQLIVMKELTGLTGIALMDRCDAWSAAIVLDMEKEDSTITPELEDVSFHAGEIFRGIETVMKLGVILGIENIEEFTNECCADFVGTKMR